jgi:hypothetical protein
MPPRFLFAGIVSMRITGKCGCRCGQDGYRGGPNQSGGTLSHQGKKLNIEKEELVTTYSNVVMY